MSADDVLVGAGVVAYGRLCPVVEGGYAAPLLLTGQDLGDVVPVVHAAARLTQDGVEPNRIADGDQTRLVGDVQTQGVALGGGGGDGGGGHGLALGGRIHIHVVDLSTAAAVNEQGVMLTLQGVGGAVGFVDHFICLVVGADLAVREQDGRHQSGRIRSLRSDVHIGGVIGGGNDVHVVLPLQKPCLHGNGRPSGRPGRLVGMVDLDLISRRVEGDPQSVAGAVGDLVGVVADVTAPHGIEPRAVTRRDDGPVHRQLSLLVVLDGGGGVGAPGRPGTTRQRGGVGIKGRVQHAVTAVRSAGSTNRSIPANGGIVVRKVRVEGVDHALLAGLHDLTQLTVGVGGVDLGLHFLHVVHLAVVELAGVLLPALQLLGGSLGDLFSGFFGRLCSRLLGGDVGDVNGSIGGGVTRRGMRVGSIRINHTADQQAHRQGQAKSRNQPESQTLHMQIFHRVPHFQEGFSFQDYMYYNIPPAPCQDNFTTFYRLRQGLMGMLHNLHFHLKKSQKNPKNISKTP